MTINSNHIACPQAENGAPDGGKAKMRLQKVDILRGLALLGMGIYHFSWDLGWFGYIAPQTPDSGALAALARCVAGSFLFLAGFSLFLAQGRGFRPRAFFRRIGVIIAAAALVSAASYIFMRQDFIYFGILHEIAFASCAGLIFLYAPLWLNIIAIAVIALAPWAAAAAGVDIAAPVLYGLGLSQNPAPSFDYVPVFPWFACVLAGLAAARIMARAGWLGVLRAGIKPLALSRLLQFIGRRSLAIYLLHQPILLALVFAAAHIAPPSYRFAMPQLKADCQTSCAVGNSAESCRNFCACVVDGLAAENQLRLYMQNRLKLTDAPLVRLRAACAGQYIDALPGRSGQE